MKPGRFTPLREGRGRVDDLLGVRVITPGVVDRNIAGLGREPVPLAIDVVSRNDDLISILLAHPQSASGNVIGKRGAGVVGSKLKQKLREGRRAKILLDGCANGIGVVNVHLRGCCDAIELVFECRVYGGVRNPS